MFPDLLEFENNELIARRRQSRRLAFVSVERAIHFQRPVKH